jgi:ARG and Rhodanese-Phosphatase-superfamily-associated Protein domain
MKTRSILLLLLLLLVSFVLYSAFITSSKVSSTPSSETSSFSDGIMEVAFGSPDSLIAYATFQVEPAIEYKNLQIFPITGRYGISDKIYITLSDALEQGYAKVNETGDVNELTMTNKSNHYIFIHSGDIVKGGKQDRTIQYDVIIPPKEKNLPLASFCVERGRWAQRENEEVHDFNGSYYNVSSRDLKVSAKKAKSQGAVWKKVSEQKSKLEANMSKAYDTTFMFENESTTSLQLTLEDSSLIEMRTDYKEAYTNFLGRTDVVGVAYAINGEVYGIDVFNNQVFLGLKEKMLDAFITEAVGDLDSSIMNNKASVADVQTLLALPKGAPDEVQSDKVNSETQFDMLVFGKVNRFITTDLKIHNWLHLNVLVESEEIEKLEEQDLIIPNFKN